MNQFVEVFYYWWWFLILGACWGSFMNVVLYRYPLGKSVIIPASACPHCNAPIAFFDNIPVLAWFLLRGRCRRCGARFSIRYALHEALFGILSGAAVLLYPVDWAGGMALAGLFNTGYPVLFLLIGYRRAPWYLIAGGSGFAVFYAAQVLGG